MKFYIFINTVAVKNTYFIFETNQSKMTNNLINKVKEKLSKYVPGIENLSNETLKDFYISKFENLVKHNGLYNIIGDGFEKLNIPQENIVFIEV